MELPKTTNSEFQLKEQEIVPPVVINRPLPVEKKIYNISSGVYIQVAAFSINRPTKILDRLANRGYHIILRHQGNITKVLVGPYSSRAKALKVLPRVKKVVPQAFIYKGN